MIIRNIQQLRGIAAILVVCFHASRSGITTELDSTLGDFFQLFGAAGVDIFFVISGFIMVYVQANKPKDPKSFLKNRFHRIVPLYWLHLILYIVIILSLPTVVASEGHAFNVAHLASSFFFVSQISFGIYPKRTSRMDTRIRNGLLSIFCIKPHVCQSQAQINYSNCIDLLVSFLEAIDARIRLWRCDWSPCARKAPFNLSLN